MRLVRFGKKGAERPGVWMGDGRILDVRALAFHIEDYNERFFSGHGLGQLRRLIEDPGAVYVNAAEHRLGAPIARPSKIVCIGANYAAHAKEFGHAVPQQPLLFSKATTAISGPADPIEIPEGGQIVDSEAELAVVMGRTASKVPASAAGAYIAGYMVLNDVTERVVQRTVGQWFHGKGFDTFCPMGPFLVTPDEIEDVRTLRVWQELNGETLQSATVGDMLFEVPFLIEHISQGITLLPGDVIATGTPPGIGSAREPQILMRAGDTVEIGIDGLGEQRCSVR